MGFSLVRIPASSTQFPAFLVLVFDSFPFLRVCPMKSSLFLSPALLTLILAGPATAQSIADQIPNAGALLGQPAPQAEPPAAAPALTAEAATVADINVDVTADSAAHARDQAVMQAQRQAYAQLCTRLGVPEAHAKIDDDSLAAMVKSFDIQSERLSAVRYIGVFTVHFKPAALQKRLGKYAAGMAVGAANNAGGTMTTGGEDPAAVQSHLTLAIDTPNLAAFAQAKKRLNELPQVVRLDTIGLGRGVSHVDMIYTGTLSDLIRALNQHGMNIVQGGDGEWRYSDTGAR